MVFSVPSPALLLAVGILLRRSGFVLLAGGVLALSACSGGPELVGSNKVEDAHPITVTRDQAGDYIAIPSTCGDFEENLAYNPNNVLAPNFGCASQNNLARAVAEPKDLVEPREVSPARAVSPLQSGGAAQ